MPEITKANNAISEENISILRSDFELMFQYAINRGLELPTNLNLDNEDNDTLVLNYNALRKVIQPATVESIRFIQSELHSKGKEGKWFQIPIFTKCVIIACIALIVLIGLSISPIVNEANQARGILESSGVALLLNLIFICAASLLGVMFYLLKT